MLRIFNERNILVFLCWEIFCLPSLPTEVVKINLTHFFFRQTCETAAGVVNAGDRFILPPPYCASCTCGGDGHYGCSSLCPPENFICGYDEKPSFKIQTFETTREPCTCTSKSSYSLVTRPFPITSFYFKHEF